MSDEKNKDILKLISEILEYTENSTPSDTPSPTNPCKCKGEGGNCGDDRNVDCPSAFDWDMGWLNCFCADNPSKTCPKCPSTPTCGCKNEGGPCGDDTSTCEPNEFGLYDMASCSGFCDPPACPKCWPPSDTPTASNCYCYQCGYEAFDTGGCTKVSCGGTTGDDCISNPECYTNCPTDSPTSTCKEEECLCNTGQSCAGCVSGYECVNRHLETCNNGCIIECGTCEPLPTDTPCITPTDTKKCKCDCGSELTFNSIAECNTWRARNCFENCTCSNITCQGDGECTPNSDCAEVSTKISPTPTSTSTCPTSCKECGAECEPSSCLPVGNSYAACCKKGTCNVSRCAIISNCDLCVQQPSECASNGGYSSKAICDANRPLPVENYVCKDCTISGTCIKEPCWCVEPVPTDTPTSTITCDCASVGYVEVGNCGNIGTAETVTVECPSGAIIDCDICNSPTPTSTCECKTPCFEYGPDCQAYKNQREANEYVNCFCSLKNISCGASGSKECTCADCIPFTPPPTPSKCSEVPPEGCCRTGGNCVGKKTRCQECDEWTEPKRYPGDPPECPPWACYAWRIKGSNQFYKNTAVMIDGTCERNGQNCTTSTEIACPQYGNKFVFLTTSPPGPADGTYRKC